MAELIVVGFQQNMYRASQVLNTLKEMNENWVVDLNDAVAVYRDYNGKLRVDQSFQATPGQGAAWGGLIGGLIGSPDARVIAATNVDLRHMVASKRFRADLYYRLNVFPIQLPSLRERPEDIPLLVRHVAREAARRMNRKVTWVASTAMDALVAHTWPGNIRELQNFVERAVIRSAGDELRVPVSDLDQGIGVSDRRTARGTTLQQAERAHILATLEATRWVLSGPHGAATRLGINRSTLQFRMKKLGINRPADELAPAE